MRGLTKTRGLGNRFRPHTLAYSGSLHNTQAPSTKELREKAKLAGVVWSELECGGVEHKMSTLEGSLGWVAV